MESVTDRPNDNTKSFTLSSVLLLLLVGFLFFCYGMAFAGWWYVSPKGFPLELPRFWTNAVIPPVVILAYCAGLWGVVRKNCFLLKTLFTTLTVATISVVVTSQLLYPISMRPFFFVPACLWCLFLLLIVWRVFRLPIKSGNRTPWGLACSILFAVAVGAFLPWSQKSLRASTHPINESLPEKIFTEWNIPREPVCLLEKATLHAETRRILFESETSRLDIYPMLRFISRSPDRFWTLFAARKDRIGPQRKLAGYCKQEDTITLKYTDDEQSILEVEPFKDRNAIAICSYTSINRPVYSHLNSFTTIQFQGSEKLFISFSVCGDERFEMTAYDYPFGRPAKFAYLDRDDMFHVVIADNAEKGPFHPLTEPDILNGPLTITLYEGETAAYRITLDDWAVQTSRQYSPTAGWKLPVNAIAFNLIEENPRVAFIHITLGDSSVGRGFDSVGHSPGVYRNHMMIEDLTVKP